MRTAIDDTDELVLLAQRLKARMYPACDDGRPQGITWHNWCAVLVPNPIGANILIEGPSFMHCMRTIRAASGKEDVG